MTEDANILPSAMAEPAFTGWVDGCVDGRITGWAREPEGDAPVVVEVLIDGTLCAAGLADVFRQDVRDAGLGNGMCGFAIAVPLESYDTRLLGVSVRVRGGDVLTGGAFSAAAAELNPDRPLPRPLVPSALPIRFDAASGYEGNLDHVGPDVLHGWIKRLNLPSPHPVLEIVENGSVIGTITADMWRKDLEETRQGDGRWGFRCETPIGLCDGKPHVIDVRSVATAASVLPQPIRVCLQATNRLQADAPVRRSEQPVALAARPLRAAPSGVTLSFIVNFYNMQREAGRTLTSLTRPYQRNIGDLNYEVLCIDNGSNPPLDAGWIASFGPEFRLFTPSALHPSPCFALNEAAAASTGAVIAAMIDGAHVLSPGVLREVWDSLEEAPLAPVGLRHWFVGADQRWLSRAGYTRAHEDILFDKIAWPHDGYKLFSISTPMWENPNHWMDDMSESNCLFVPRALWQQVGGFDEAFAEPGAGYANLDLFARVSAASPEPVVTLVGEASFHQFHDGTTTNVGDAEKEKRVQKFENTYIALRKGQFASVQAERLRFRGTLRNRDASNIRQRPLSPAGLGVTTHLRDGQICTQFDQRSADYLSAAYVECGLVEYTKWRGHKIRLAPSDIVVIQELVFEQRPGRIVVVNPQAGLLMLLADVARLCGVPCKIVAVGEPCDVSAVNPIAPVSLCQIISDAHAPETLAAVRRAISTEEKVLVLVQPGVDDFLPTDLIANYGDLVSYRGYMVVLNTVYGQPFLGYSQYWFRKAITQLVQTGRFTVDEARNPHLISTCAMGYLQRTGGVMSAELSDAAIIAATDPTSTF